jgi:hypothetical protein
MAEENQRSKTKIVCQGETVHDSVYCSRSIYKNILFIKEILIWRVGIENERARLILAFMIGEEGKYNTFTSF